MNKAVFITLFLAFTPIHTMAKSVVVGYYPAWLKSTLPAENIQYENLTHINHAFAWPEADGSIVAYDNLIYPQLNQKAHREGKKVLIALGGWGQSDGFSPMAANSTTRASFIQNIIEFCQRNGYDGMDIDWEFPANVTDRNNLTLLVYELRQAFNEKKLTLLLTMAVPASDWSGKWFDFSTLKAHVDWFGCMTYDIHGNWSDHAGHNAPLYAPANDPCGSVHTGIQYLNLTRNVPKEKILLGIPFYGKLFHATSLHAPSSGGNDIIYSKIVPLIGKNWVYRWDDVSKVPYLISTNSAELISFDDTVSVRLKCEYAQQNGLAGAMIWALGQDVIGFNQPLLEAVGRAMKSAVDIRPFPEEAPTSFVLLNNYPNPFNANTVIPFYVPTEGRIALEIFNIAGERVSILLDEQKAIGWHYIKFSADGLPSGLYFYRLSASNFLKMNKMLLVR